MSTLANQSLERFDSIANSVNQLRQRWDKRLRLPLSKLGERYIRGDLMILVDLKANSSEIILGDGITLCVRNRLSNEVRAGSGLECDLGRTRYDHQFPVLVDSVHVVDDQEHSIFGIASEVGLRFIDELSDIGVRNALYFSLVSPKFVFRNGLLRENRKLNGGLMGASVGCTGKVPNNVVKARAQVVNDFPSDNAKAERDRAFSMVIDRLLPLLVLWIGHDWVWAFLKEDTDLPFKISDVLIGPF